MSYSFLNKHSQEQVIGASTKNQKLINSQKKPTPTPQVSKTPTPTTVASPSATPTVTAISHYVYLGMWTQGLWDESNYTLHPEKLTQLQTQIGKNVAIAHFYHGWQNLVNASLVSELTTISNNGWRPMISMNPYFFDKCPANGQTLYKAIANGNCDDFLRQGAQTLKQYGQPVLFRFAWEMNIPSIEWSVAKTGDTPADYAAAWRHMHDLFVSQGATNVLWVFCPDVGGSISYSSLYPGDSYVDWVGLDGYNWGTTQSWSSWQSFTQVFSSSYNQLVSVAPSKPLMLGEVNTTNVGGDKAAWYTDMLTVQIPQNFPKIKAVVFYNEDRTATEHVNWLIDVTPESLAAFSAGVKNPMYLSHL